MSSNLSDSPAPDPSADEIDLTAAEWLVAHDHGLDAGQRKAFECWLEADPRHPVAYARLKDVWHQLDRVPAERVPLPAAGRRPWFWVATALAAAAAVALAVFLPGRFAPKPATAARSVVQRAATPVGGFERLDLPDGSIVRVNTASEVAVEYSATQRRVVLVRGEASFEVEKDAARPFIVRAGGVDVRAVGTAFSIREKGASIEVLVTEGRVRVDSATSGRSVLPKAMPATSDAADVPVLSAGQRATLSKPAADVPVAASVMTVPADVSARALAWHTRQLEFSDEPLANIVAEFNRYNTHQLRVEGADLGAQRFGGKFPADDFASLVRVLENNFNVQAERGTHETVLRRGPAGR
ncbi:MAG TPA: FecR domain-containing protein [Opitutaceae bacterium]